MQNELQRLLPRHYEIMRLCLLGVSRNDIAIAMKMTPEGIGLIINSPLFQDELAKRRESGLKRAEELGAHQDLEAIEILRKASSDAANTHVSLLNSADERVAQASANAILDRVLSKKDTGEGVKFDEQIIINLQMVVNELKVINLPQNLPSVERKDVEVA